MKKSSIPPSVFVGISVEEGHLYFAVHNYEKLHVERKTIDIEDVDDFIFCVLDSYQKEHNVKIVAAGIGETDQPEKLGEEMWLKLDIVPYLTRGTGESGETRACHLAETIVKDYIVVEELDIAQVHVTEDRKVHPSFLTTLQAYHQCSNKQDMGILEKQVKRFKGLEGNILFINSTPQGGGVALMRHALIRLYRLFGIQASWYVMKPKPEVFDITKKKFHNMLQGVAPKSLVLTDEDKELYNEWIRENEKVMEGPIKHANVIVIDDYQPSGLIPLIKEINPSAKIMYRSHIHIDTSLLENPNSAQNVTWKFIWDHNKVKEADTFIAHPIPEFVPTQVPEEKVIFMPATTDALDGLNKPLTDDQIGYYIKLFNRMLTDDDQKPLDRKRPYIIQVARFDPSKGIPDVLESYHLLRKRFKEESIPIEKTPQLVIVGHGAVDDPEGVPILEETKMTLEMDHFMEFADDIKLARFPHNDQILDALLRGSHVAMQLSHKEGLEVKVSESLHKGKPVIIYRAGGMPLQVLDGINAFVIEKGQTHQVAEHLYSLFTDAKLYEKMSANALKDTNPNFFTIHNAYKWLFMANELLEKGHIEGNGENINDVIERLSK